MRKFALAASIGLTASFAACIFPDLSGFENGGNGAGQPTGPGVGGAGGAGPGSGANAAGGSGASQGSGAAAGNGSGGGPLGPCDLRAGQSGPKGVEINDIYVKHRCIDAMETTWKDYIAFANAADLVNDPPPTFCAFKTTNPDLLPLADLYGKYDADPAAAAKQPVQGVDWCDAKLYCLWAGKDLCGDGTGHPVDATQVGWETRTEWFHACHDNPPEDFSGCYKADPGQDIQEDEPVDSNCKSAGGLYHMGSNVWEWEDNCLPFGGSGPEDDDCRYRGAPDVVSTVGEFEEHCGWDNNNGPDAGGSSRADADAYHIGIRCCWAASP